MHKISITKVIEMNDFSINFRKKIYSIKNDDCFNELALELFHYQISENPIYKEFSEYIKVDKNKVLSINQIPFLPVQFFKSHRIATRKNSSDYCFTSSATTGLTQARHFINDLSLYEDSFNYCFRNFFGNPSDYCIIGLLPSYLERKGSSLIYMVENLISQSKNEHSGYYLYNHDELTEKLNILKNIGQKTILFGVTFALTDYAKNNKIDFENLTIIETGGMKGRQKEITREELHEILKSSFKSSKIVSEYGMTELLSQAYTNKNGRFEFPHHARVLIRELNDPLSLQEFGYQGGVNIIDLANIESCAFIATQDIGKLYKDNSFEILGRFDNADVRGCSLLLS